MNSGQLSAVLLAYARGLKDKAAARDLEALGAVLAGHGARPLSSVVKRTAAAIGADKIETTPSGPRARDLAAALSDLEAVLQPAARPAALTALRLVLTLLAEHSDMAVSQLFTSLKEPFGKPATTKASPATKLDVSAEVAALKAAQTDPKAFSALLDQLKGDPRIKLAEANALANEMTGMVQKRSKKDAFSIIEKQHRYAMDAKARREAADGKSAA